MKVLVTGGLGLIGYATATHLRDLGADVFVCDDGRSVEPENLQGLSLDFPTSVERLAQDCPPVDAVVHCAAPVGPVGILGRNVLREMTSATEAAVHIARRHDARLVAFSSSEVYGTTHPTDTLCVPDEWSHRTEYGVGKLVTEQIARRHHSETGLGTMVVRPWNITGPRQSASAGFVFPRMAQQVAQGHPVTVYRPGDQRRAFMDVGDLASLIAARVLSDDPQHWDGVPVDAANPDNAIAMRDLAYMFTKRIALVDPTVEHGPSFREAAAGSKLPPPRPALRGWTPLDWMVAEALEHAGAYLGAAA